MVFTCTFPCNPVFQFQRLFTRSRLQQHHSAPPLLPSNLKPSSSSSSSHHYSHTFSLIQDSAVIACLRANSAEQAMEAARAAVNGGIAVLEIVRSTPGVFEVLQALANEYPTKAFGVGTVLTAKDARTAIKAGAKFLMSPATVNEEKIKHDRKGILTEQTGKAELFFPMPMSFMCPISEAQTFLLGSVQASDTCSTRNAILI
ncbi:hypothetical protein ES332_D10G242400v1 [Gossypium tomentosum]|uniref:KHG/KDPG aldolase n=1 Tax=Gossypium tomentosum TaxID=34277 RepID=A0A5D2J995_GOSTO|nr:hypothetical protein ES332_D10G242400v1 [Gossypium tomentosum]